MRYFELIDDMSIRGRWLLGTPLTSRGQVVSGVFWRGQPIQVNGPLRIPISHPGIPLEFSMADTGGVPVVHVKIATVLAELASNDVQLIPVEIDSQPDQYCLVKTLRVIKCVDDDASEEVHYWKPEDDEPELLGRYRAVLGLRIDTSKVGDAKIFRAWGWEVALVVREDIKDAMERVGATGAKFIEVG